MSELTPYTRRALELRAAKYYTSIRKPKNEWQTIEDLMPQLVEFEHLMHIEHFNEAGELLQSISDHLHLWGYYAQLFQMQERLLDHLVTPHLQVENLIRLGRAAYAMGMFEQALEYDKSALHIAQTQTDMELEGLCLGSLGDVLQNLGHSEEAFEYHQQAVTLFCRVGNHRKEAHWLRYLARDYRILGKVNQAISYYKRALRFARKVNDPENIGRILGDLGQTYCVVGWPERAYQLIQQGLVIVGGTSDRRYKGLLSGILGLVYHDLGQAELAVEAYHTALSITCDIGNRRGELTHLGDLGITQYALGNIAQAIALHNQALDIARQIHDRRRESYNLIALGRALLKSNKLLEARKYCEDACALDVVENSYWAYFILSVVHQHFDYSQSAKTFCAAVDRCSILLEKSENWCRVRYTLAAALVGQAVCASRWSNLTQRVDLLAPAIAEYRRALAITSVPGIVRDALHDLELISAAGVEGLEPVFELLEGALNE